MDSMNEVMLKRGEYWDNESHAAPTPPSGIGAGWQEQLTFLLASNFVQYNAVLYT